MKIKTLVNGSILFIGLGLTAYSWLNGYRVRFNIEDIAVDAIEEQQPQQKFERWQLKKNSIYDGDTIRATKDGEEIRVRFCGIDAPEVKPKQPMGIESRDYLRSLVDIGNGELLLVPIEKDRYGRTVAELYVQDRKNSAIPLNLQMVRDGYAWHYQQYSANCPSHEQFAIAQQLAQSEKLGIWQQGNPQPPWDYRKSKKAKK